MTGDFSWIELRIMPTENSEFPKKAADGPEMERRQLARLNLSKEQFRLAENGRIYSIIDLSNSGLALRMLESDDLELFPVGRDVEGHINLLGRRIPVQLQVRHVRSDLVGLNFVDLADESGEVLDVFLDPKTLAKDLKRMPSPVMRTQWFHGHSGTELVFYEADDAEIYRFLFQIHGTYVQWDKDEGIQTGKILESDERSQVHGVIRLETLLLDCDAKPDPKKIAVALILAESSNLPASLRELSQKRLKK